jgi:flagellar protein FlbT
VNGAVIENGDRRARLSILTPDANILRLRDAIHPDSATTPVRRVCYALQLVLTGDAEPEEMHLQLLRSVEQLSRALTDHDSRRHLDQASDALIARRYYHCLKALRALIPREDRLLAAGRRP